MLKVLSSTLLILVYIQPALAVEQTAVITVDGMMCGADPHIVRKVLSDLRGVDDVQISLEHKSVVVSFDNEVVTVAQLLQATGAAGYPAHVGN